MTAIKCGCDLSACGLSLFECCSCRCSKHDPVALNCLHYCCRSCLKSSGSRSTVACPACCEVTDVGTLVTNTFLLGHKRTSALHCENVLCQSCHADELVAELWCVDCCKALCPACHMEHSTFFDDHRIFELAEARTLPLSQLMPSVQCSLHKRRITAHCCTCCEPKCQMCSQRCWIRFHHMRVLSEKTTQQHISRLTDVMGHSRERLRILLSGLRQKCQVIVSRLQEDRRNGRVMLVKHRRQFKDSTVNAFNRAMSEICVNQQTVRYACSDVNDRRFTLSCTANIGALSRSRILGLSLCGEVYLLRKVALRCFSSGKVLVKMLQQRWQDTVSIGIYGSVPLTADIVLNACLGATCRKRCAPRVPLLFGRSSVTVYNPVFYSDENGCVTIGFIDLAVTRDGQVLVAAGYCGLLVYSNSGKQLSSWNPGRSYGTNRVVRCVAALSDGRAAVGVATHQFVVLLTRSNTCDTWQEDRRVAVPLSSPHLLAAHGDLLAVTETKFLPWPSLWLNLLPLHHPGREVKLLSLSCGLLLYSQSRDYDIARVAVTALCLVTTSYDRVKRNVGAAPYVLDAFSHSGEFLWSYETSNEEALGGLCVSADSWSRVYVAVGSLARESYRVMAISGADGRDRKEVLRLRGVLPNPDCFVSGLSLSSGQQKTVLAVMQQLSSGFDSSYTVSLHEAIGDGERVVRDERSDKCVVM